MPQIRQYPQATSLLPTDAFIIDRIGTGTEYITATNALPTSIILALNSFYEGSTPPTTSQLLGGWVVPFAITMPADYASAVALGWGLHVLINATAPFVITLAHNGVFAGSITINADGTWSYSSSGGVAWTMAKDDYLTATAPSVTDNTLNNFFWTMVGTRT